MIPVAIDAMGTQLRRKTVLFHGWFDDMADEGDEMIEAEPVPESPLRWITSSARKAQQ